MLTARGDSSVSVRANCNAAAPAPTIMTDVHGDDGVADDDDDDDGRCWDMILLDVVVVVVVVPSDGLNADTKQLRRRVKLTVNSSTIVRWNMLVIIATPVAVWLVRMDDSHYCQQRKPNQRPSSRYNPSRIFSSRNLL
jgi:hypothetical protein